MRPQTAKRKHARKRKRTPRRRSITAAALRKGQHRQRKVPSKKYKLESWHGDTIRALFAVERF